jgi:hypothetical protein
MKALPVIVALGMATVLAASSRESETVLRVYADQDNDVHVVVRGQKETVVPHERDQAGIQDVKIATDRKTAGWLVTFKDPDSKGTYAAYLKIWRGGKVIRSFRGESTFWSWSFVDGAKEVAYHTAPMHEGPTSRCELRDVRTGGLLSSWKGNLEDTTRPSWTKSLDH